MALNALKCNHLTPLGLKGLIVADDNDDDVIVRLKSSSYDVLLAESLDPCSGVIADYLDVPFILMVTTGLGQFDPNPRLPSYLPVAIAPFTDHMEFGQRMLNVLLKLLYDFIIPSFVAMNAPFEQLRIKYQLNRSLSLDDTFKRASLRCCIRSVIATFITNLVLNVQSLRLSVVLHISETKFRLDRGYM